MLNDFRRASSSNSAPVTTALVCLIAGTFLVTWFAKGLGQYLMFAPGSFGAKPWTALVYPFASTGDGNGLIAVLFGTLWLWGIGGAVERDLGAKRYLGFWIASTLLGAIGFWIGSMVAGSSAGLILFGALVPVACITVAWGTRNPNAPITLMFVLPITGKWIAWISAGLVFLGTNSPIAAPFAALACVAAWAFAAEKLAFLPYSAVRSASRKETVKEKREFESYIDQVRDREKDREERERLRKLFESSLDDDRKSS